MNWSPKKSRGRATARRRRRWMPATRFTITYGNRPSDDQRAGYDGGGATWSRTKRINEIEVTYDDGSTVSEIATYDLSYESTSASGRSQLSEVSVCRGSECLPATTVTVQDATPGWYNAAPTQGPIGGNPLLGDGTATDASTCSKRSAADGGSIPASPTATSARRPSIPASPRPRTRTRPACSTSTATAWPT